MKTLKTRSTLIAPALFAVGMALTSMPSAAGLVSTDRFGYDGTILRYASLNDAQQGTGEINEISVTDRDLSLFIANNDPWVSNNWNVVMGPWWYTTDPDGSLGSGNTNGNTGVGFMQLFDQDGSTDTSVSMNFNNFDGTHYTDFTLELQGENANRADDSSRLSAIDNTNDGGTWHNYNLNLTATGLEGQSGSSGGNDFIQSINQPTGVTGNFTGLFEITENQTSPANQGFYTVDFNLNMDNWAWENRDSLTYPEGGFADSTFRVVPEPSALGLICIGLLGLVTARRGRATAPRQS